MLTPTQTLGPVAGLGNPAFKVVPVADPPRFASTAASDRFEDVFHRFYSDLFGVTYRLLGDRGETEDTLQEAFFRLADSAVLSQPDPAVAAWLRRVCLNLGSNRLRAQRRARERLERVARLDNLDGVESVAASPSSVVLRQEEQAQVRHALADLPERQRNVLILRHSGYSYAEIAATLDIAIGSVGVLLARAERAFRASYQPEASDRP